MNKEMKRKEIMFIYPSDKLRVEHARPRAQKTEGFDSKTEPEASGGGKCAVKQGNW